MRPLHRLASTALKLSISGLLLLSQPALATPEIPTPVAPLQEASTNQPAFSWQHQTDALRYVLAVTDRSTGERVHWQSHSKEDVCDDTLCSFTPDIELGFSNLHVWHVRSANASGASPWARTIFAYKDELPLAPEAISPLVAAQNPQPVFSWSPQPGALRYVLLVVDRTTGERVHWKTHYREDVCNDTECSYTPDINLGFSSQHVWYVRSWNFTGASAWTKTVFALQDDPPSVPEQLAPLTTTESFQPDLQWAHDAAATSYVVVLHDVSNDSRLLWKSYSSTDVCTANTCSIATPSPLDYTTRYVWYVRSKNSTNASAWAKTFFTTADNTNQRPIANSDAVTIEQGSEVVIDVLANDTDPDNTDDNNPLFSINPASITIIAPGNTLPALNGSVEIINGTVVYTHDGSIGDSAAFQYTISDRQGAVSEPATVIISIENALAKTLSPSDITDLILVTGQSNVRGSQTEFEAPLDTIDLRVFAYTNTDDWEVADLHQAWDVDGWHPGNGSLEPYCLANPECTPRQPYNNFAFHFAKTVVEQDPNRVVGIIIAGAPGEGISHWDQGSEFTQTIQSKVVAALNAQGVKSRLDGILWHQGETDWQIEGTSDPDASNFEQTYVNYYPDKLNDLISRFRGESWFGVDKPFICGETRQAPVNQTLMMLESDNDPWTGCVLASDLDTMEQDLTTSPPQYGTHFDAPGLRSLGARYALRYLEMTTQ